MKVLKIKLKISDFLPDIKQYQQKFYLYVILWYVNAVNVQIDTWCTNTSVMFYYSCWCIISVGRHTKTNHSCEFWDIFNKIIITEFNHSGCIHLLTNCLCSFFIATRFRQSNNKYTHLVPRPSASVPWWRESRVPLVHSLGRRFSLLPAYNTTDQC